MDELEEIRERKMKELEDRFMKKEPKNAKPIEVSDQTFDKTVKDNPALVVDFWASWCMPCLMMAPTIESLAKKFAGKVTFGKLNVDNNKKTAAKYEVMAIPTLLFFKDGKMVDQVTGNVPHDALGQKVKKTFG